MSLLFVINKCSLFFFSGGRRHTSYIGDWSSDVCFPICARGAHRSPSPAAALAHVRPPRRRRRRRRPLRHRHRSEERRVGKECRPRWLEVNLKNKRDGEQKHTNTSAKERRTDSTTARVTC